MKYIAYCRKSSDEKDRQVLSIPAQVEVLKEFAKREHLEIVEWIEEEKTAKVPGREKFNEMLKKIELSKGAISGILAWHPDRLARNSVDGGKIIYLLDLQQLTDLKFPQYWFENTPQGKFMLGIAFNQSKYYVDNLSENVERGMTYKIKNGVWPVRAPLGYYNHPKKRTIEVDEEMARIVKKNFEYFAQGNKSFADVARFLYKFKVTNRKGGILKKDFAKKMLTNRFYIGIMKYKGEYYPATHKKIISKELFDKAQKSVEKILKPRKTKHYFAFTQ